MPSPAILRQSPGTPPGPPRTPQFLGSPGPHGPLRLPRFPLGAPPPVSPPPGWRWAAAAHQGAGAAGTGGRPRRWGAHRGGRWAAPPAAHNPPSRCSPPRGARGGAARALGSPPSPSWLPRTSPRPRTLQDPPSPPWLPRTPPPAPSRTSPPKCWWVLGCILQSQTPPRSPPLSRHWDPPTPPPPDCLGPPLPLLHGGPEHPRPPPKPWWVLGCILHRQTPKPPWDPPPCP